MRLRKENCNPAESRPVAERMLNRAAEPALAIETFESFAYPGRTCRYDYDVTASTLLPITGIIQELLVSELGIDHWDCASGFNTATIDPPDVIRCSAAWSSRLLKKPRTWRIWPSAI
jgi:hypothetical protein